ncbi:hypothetical protein [Tateyamaria sp.]|uniref:PD-(D/E)XK nuclease domain-containing protein n=1 Tax=Tateyamaria sp. TaxID=1929288 RepID=UPI003B21DF3D
MTEMDFCEHVATLRARADKALYHVASVADAAAAGGIGSGQHWDEIEEQVETEFFQAVEIFAFGLLNLCDRERLSTLSGHIRDFWDANKGHTITIGYYDFPDGPESHVLERLKQFSKALPINTRPTLQHLDLVVTALEQLGSTIENLGRTTSKEKDVQDVLEIVLRSVFPDLIPYPSTSKQTKTFKPDLGVETAGLAIEVKFARTSQEAKTALGGIYEDMKGYAGDRHWRDFVGVIYMHKPFLSQKQVNAELKKVGCPKNWSVKTVVGP